MSPKKGEMRFVLTTALASMTVLRKIRRSKTLVSSMRQGLLGVRWLFRDHDVCSSKYASECQAWPKSR